MIILETVMLCSLSIMDSSKNNVTNSISNSWHTDCLGHKLNMLICTEGGKIPTFYRHKQGSL